MIGAAAELLRDYPQLGVVIVGGGEGMGELRKHAVRLGVDDRVVTPGIVPYDRIPDYVNCFDVGIAMDDAARHRQFGNSYQKVRQYIACGVPVVSVAGTGLPMEEHALGSIVDPDDMPGIVSAIRVWLAIDDNQRSLHRDRAAAFAQRHLSVESTLTRRLEFWSSSIQVGS